MNDRIDETSVSLVERVRHRDAEAWSRLVRLYGPVVYYWCRHQFGIADQDAQDVFAAVHRAIGRFRRERDGAFRGWLWSITRNKVRDHARSRQALTPATGGSEHLAHLHQQPEFDGPPDSSLSDESSICRRVLEFVRCDFEESSWRAFWRTAIDGQTSNDVALELGSTPAAVRKAKSRVLARLRRELDGLVDFD